MDRNGVYQLPLLERYLQFRSFIKCFITGILCRYIPAGSVIASLVEWGYRRLARMYRLQVILKKRIIHYLSTAAVFL